MMFTDTHVNNEMRYSIGTETQSSCFYLSIPVSNQLADYEEYYEISKEIHDSYPNNVDVLNEFAERCKAQLCDHLLIIKPGRDRGIA